jgi:ribosomal protein S18 acetylase RimI-like enzyme
MKIRNMTALDLPAALRLKEIAGWNQTADDWKRFMKASPEGCFVAEVDGEVRGTVTTISFEHRFAWVGMVLVDPEYRGEGMGTRLLEMAINYLDSARIPCIKLDATPQGKPLYEKLGFVSEYEVERWILKRTAQEQADVLSTPTSAHLPSSLLEADREVFGADRRGLLKSLHQDAPAFTQIASKDQHHPAYALGRRGSFADHMGPWIATHEDSARVLLEQFLARSQRETVIVDCPKANGMPLELLKSLGFIVSRPLTRMYRGLNRNPGRPQSVCAIMGPEFG